MLCTWRGTLFPVVVKDHACLDSSFSFFRIEERERNCYNFSTVTQPLYFFLSIATERRDEMLLMTWHETSSWDENEAVNVTDISWIQGEGKWSGFECFFLLYLFFQLRRDENRWDEQEKKNLSLESCLCLALTASDCNTMCSVSLFTCEVNALNSQFECVCREEREREEVMEEGFSYVPSVSQHLRHQQEILCHEVPFFSWRRRRKSKKLISLVFVVCVWVSCKRQREKEEIQGQNQDHKRYVRVFQEW